MAGAVSWPRTMRAPLEAMSYAPSIKPGGMAHGVAVVTGMVLEELEVEPVVFGPEWVFWR